MAAEPRFCSEQSLAREEALLGTASTVRRWILVEQNGPWGADALEDNRLGERPSALLRRIGRTTGARVLLIRKHGRYEQEGFRVMVSFTGRRQRWLEELFFADVERLLAHDYAPLRDGRSVGGQPVEELRFFVCTHGKHDPCCAREGRKVCAALQEALPEATWETSHIGGDRFAGNVLILPLGFYYGRVGADDAVPLMEQLRGGVLDLRHFRGRSCYPFAAQAAESLARERMSLRGVDDLALVRHEELEPHCYRATFRVAPERAPDPERHVTVDIEVGRGPEACLTCHSSGPSAPPRYRLLALQEGGQGSGQES